jgi:hypothetical protein
MKKTLQGILILSMVFLLTACSKDSTPVKVGNVSFKFDEGVWEITKNVANAPLEFTDKNDNKLSLNVSQESTYQHPMAMISFLESMISGSDGFQVFLEPNEITVNGTKWYEYGYLYKEGSTTHKIYQRYYGKYYNVASITYTSTLDQYDSSYDKAIKFMSDIKVEDVPNEINEAKAKEFLVGEWDLNGSGYLVLTKDGSYEWFRDATKDNNNKHYGTYGCDIENTSLEMVEGDAIYLVLFPEDLVVNGESIKSMQYKADYIISLENEEPDEYQMVNISSYSTYTITKQ